MKNCFQLETADLCHGYGFIRHRGSLWGSIRIFDISQMHAALAGVEGVVILPIFHISLLSGISKSGDGTHPQWRLRSTAPAHQVNVVKTSFDITPTNHLTPA